MSACGFSGCHQKPHVGGPTRFLTIDTIDDQVVTSLTLIPFSWVR
jgi:hypothetical protein